MVTRGNEGGRMIKWVKGVKYMVMDGNKTFGGEYAIMYTDIKLKCYRPKTYTMLLTDVTLIKINKFKTIN